MSILIGIICPEAIVLAADSHITDPYSLTHSSVDKISVIKFSFDEVLIAQAGLWPLTNRVVQIMRKKAKGIKITGEDVVAKMIEDSIRETKSPLDEEQKALVNQQPPGLMVAFYVGTKPYIYSIGIYGSGFVNQEQKHYVTMGAGAELAEYLLNEYAMPQSHSDHAIATSIFAIKKVKDTTKACGGDTMIKRLVPLQMRQGDIPYITKSEKVNKQYVELAEKQLVKLYEQVNKSLHKKIFPVLQKIGNKIWAQNMKKIKAEQEEEEEYEREARLNSQPVEVFSSIENTGENKP